MKKLWTILAVVIIVIACSIVAVLWYLNRFQFGDPLVFQADYPLATPSSRFDYQTFGDDGVLYMNHMGHNSVIAYNTKTNTIDKEIAGIGSPRGVAVSKKFKRVYVTSPDSDEVFVIDEATNAITKKIKVGANPDGIDVDDDDDKVFVTNESGDSVSVINQTTLQETSTIKLSSSVGNTKYDAINHLVYTAVHDENFVIIDPVQEAVTQTITLTDCDTPHGFGFDPVYHQALVTCQGNSIGIVIDLTTGAELYRSTVGTGADVVAVDVQKHIGIVSSAAGIASVFQFGNTPTKLGDQFIAVNAHTVAINEATHSVYFPIEKTAGPMLKVYALPH